MSEIIVQRRPKSNNFPSHSSNVSPNPTDSFSFKRPWLPTKQFQDANQQKIMWMQAAFQEARLKGNENHVLEALVFLTDPIYGHGEPSVGAIQERCAENGVFIHYDTVRQCLKRLEQKGAISIEFRGKQLTNHYRLIGFEYKSECSYREPLDSNNSPSLPKGERGRSKSKNIGKAPLAAVCSYALPEDEQDLDKRATPEFAQSKMHEIRAMLSRIN